MLLPMMRDRALSALVGAPDVLEALLGSLPPADPRWDTRPDPNRFSLREIVAHLADYELIWMDHLTRTLGEIRPTFIRVDPEQLCLEHDYAHSDFALSLARFRERRMALVDYLVGLDPDEWKWIGLIGENGALTLEEQVSFVVIHDGYHTGEIAQWLAA